MEAWPGFCRCLAHLDHNYPWWHSCLSFSPSSCRRNVEYSSWLPMSHFREIHYHLWIGTMLPSGSWSKLPIQVLMYSLRRVGLESNSQEQVFHGWYSKHSPIWIMNSVSSAQIISYEYGDLFQNDTSKTACVLCAVCCLFRLVAKIKYAMPFTYSYSEAESMWLRLAGAPSSKHIDSVDALSHDAVLLERSYEDHMYASRTKNSIRYKCFPKIVRCILGSLPPALVFQHTPNQLLIGVHHRAGCFKIFPVRIDELCLVERGSEHTYVSIQ
jgi:hypothetical protein